MTDNEKAVDKDLKYLIEQAMAAEEFCGKICGHNPTDTIREVESEAFELGHGLMIALNPYRSRSTASPEPEKPCDYCRYPAGTHGPKCKAAPAPSLHGEGCSCKGENPEHPSCFIGNDPIGKLKASGGHHGG